MYTFVDCQSIFYIQYDSMYILYMQYLLELHDRNLRMAMSLVLCNNICPVSKT